MNKILNQILNRQTLEQKIRRMAYNIWEQNDKYGKVAVAGIVGGGQNLAVLLAKQIRNISSLEVDLIDIEIDKSSPHNSAQLIVEKMPQNLIIVDDVLNTGRTLFYALSALNGQQVEKVSVAVMVNRGGYRQFPVAADVVGYELSTTLREHVSVIFEGEDAGVYLF